MDKKLFEELNGFLGRASKATYAGDSGEIESWRTGFKELEYSENAWYYQCNVEGSIYKFNGHESIGT